MTLDTFKEVISLLKKNSDKTQKIYKAGVDLYNLNDELQSAINIMIKVYYSELGEDMISWWLWEDVEKKLYDSNDNVINDLTKIEDLWKYVEEIRTSSDFEEYTFKKKKKFTKKQVEKIFSGMW